jgi:hypothetical protein
MARPPERADEKLAIGILIHKLESATHASATLIAVVNRAPRFDDSGIVRNYIFRVVKEFTDVGRHRFGYSPKKLSEGVYKKCAITHEARRYFEDCGVSADDFSALASGANLERAHRKSAVSIVTSNSSSA